MKSGDPFFPRDLVDKSVEPRNYKFNRPWGLPVRFHDYKDITANTNPDLMEFHMSYRDLDTPPSSVMRNKHGTHLVVHGVETFENDHILDLASSKEEYRIASIKNLQKCINHARALKPYFPKTKRPLIVVNAGGFTKHAPLEKDEELKVLYDRVADSLSKLDKDGVEIIIQSMPPYPWLLGGQMFHNLFLDPESMADFCKEHGYRICFDVSHSYLAANHLNRTLTEYLEILGPYIAHIHMGDGSSVGEEGLQIGDGTIDFKQLKRDLDRNAPKASFIPEIWQGHENGGEGFWIALERLERWF
jgi:N-acetylneuraminate synthase